MPTCAGLVLAHSHTLQQRRFVNFRPSAHFFQVSALPPFDSKRALSGLADVRELLAVVRQFADVGVRMMGQSPRATIAEMWQRRTLSVMDPAAWAAALRHYQQPAMADIWPGKFSRCVRAVLIAGRAQKQ